MLRRLLARLRGAARPVCIGAPAPELLPVGGPAPAFEVLDHEGATVSSRGLAGRRYVLWFYPKADTPG